jgi:uncharacterized protein YceH (UPF0502 family)
VELSPEEVRVLGSLVEKELTTPQQYPLTLNALVAACNQSSNRDPVVSYDERAVEQAVIRAKERGLARFIHPSHGRSALRYRHELAEQWGVDQRQLALLAVLMLRGPQTLGELRARTERMADLDGIGEIEAELSALAGREEPLVRRVGRVPGQKEDRFVHCLSAASASVSTPSAAGPTGSAEANPAGAPGDRPPVTASAADLADELAGLRREVEAVRRELDELRAQLGG